LYFRQTTNNNSVRPLSPSRKKEKRDPFAPKKLNPPAKDAPKRPSEPDKWDGGGGSIYHSATPIARAIDPADPELSKIKRVQGIKRDLKGKEHDRELRRVFKSFARPKVIKAATAVVEEEEQGGEGEGGKGEVVESVAFDARRVRGIGFDPRWKANEEVRVNPDRKISPIRGSGGGKLGKISLEGVLGGMKASRGVAGGPELEDSDSDSDLDIVME